MSFESNVVEVSAMNRYTKLGKIKNKATIYDIVNANTLDQVIAPDNGSDGNKGMFPAYVGPLSSYGCRGNNIIPHKIAFKRRNDPNNTGDTLRTVSSYARILSLTENNTWDVAYQSYNSITVSSYDGNSFTEYWVLDKVSDTIINASDTIAVTFVSSLAAAANDCINFGTRTTPQSSSIKSYHQANGSGNVKQLLSPKTSNPTNFSPVFDIIYSSDIFDNGLHTPIAYELSASADVSTSDVLTSIDHPIIGDYAIVNRYITSNIVEKTAYTYANEGNAVVWKALDGNYDAENVYFGSNLIATENVGTISIPQGSGSTTVNVSGLNLKQALMKILAKEKYPSVSQPKVTIRFTNVSSVEYGSTITPKATVSFNAGSYQYQPSTGVTMQNGTITTTNTTSSINNVGLFTFPDYCITPDTNYGGKTYTASVSLNHSAGHQPKTNLGNNATVEIPDAEGNPVAAIPSGTINANSSNSFSGYAAGRIYGYVTDDLKFSETNVSENTDIINNNDNMKKSEDGKIAGTFEFDIHPGAKTIYIGAYGTHTLTKVLNTTNNSNMTARFTIINPDKPNETVIYNNIPIYGASDKFTGYYTIWSYTPAEPYVTDAHFIVTIS